MYHLAGGVIETLLHLVVYLKSDINIVSGNGTMDSPYELSLKA